MIFSHTYFWFGTTKYQLVAWYGYGLIHTIDFYIYFNISSKFLFTLEYGFKAIDNFFWV